MPDLSSLYNGPEFFSAVLRWLAKEGIETAYISPGKPWQDGTDESVNGRLRDKCLSMELLSEQTGGGRDIEGRRRHYNEVRSHSFLGYLTPEEFKKQMQITSTKTAEAAL